jgi:hypothetical protein
MTPAAKFLPVTTTPAVNFATSFTSVVDTGGKFETALMGHSGDGGKLIHEKTSSKKSRDTVSLKGPSRQILPD